MSIRSVLRTNAVEAPKQDGEFLRLRVLKGPDRGVVFISKSDSISLGRGEEADVQLSDLKCSRKHAHLKLIPGGRFQIQDLESSNGVQVRGKIESEATIGSGERFEIGDSVIEVLASSEDSRILARPLESLQKIEEQNYYQQLRAQGPVQSTASQASTPQVSNKAKKNPLRMILIALMGYFVYTEYFMTPETAPQLKKPKKVTVKDMTKKELESLLPSLDSPALRKSADQSFQLGLREYREANFLRARSQFALTLSIQPDHQLARYYFHATENEMEKQLSRLVQRAARSKALGKDSEAKTLYQSAKRLIGDNLEHPLYHEVKEGIEELQKRETQ